MIDFLMNLHWLVLAKIVALDILLGVDNAIIIAMAVAGLSVDLRNKAIIFGTAGAVLARILFLFVGFWLVGLPFVKLLAGGYLIYLGYTMLTSHGDDVNVAQKTTLFGASMTIVFADIVMSLDNVVALVGASDGTGDHALGYTIFGILLSIPIIIFASKGLIKVLDKFPILIWLGSGLISWVGIEMLLKEPFLADQISTTHATLIGVIVVTVSLLCAWYAKRNEVQSV